MGGASCAGCHAAEYAAWSQSHHAQAMQPANARSVLGDFNDASCRKGRQLTTFFRRNDRYQVRAQGTDGRPADFEIRWTFGVWPLQQYLVDFPDGRKQVLGIAWDSRPKSAGGRRWFDLYPDELLVAGDRLHWTGIDQTWNHQCADCHSTGLRKNFDPQTGQFHTTWQDVDVGCEACHGPGSNHIAWAGKRAMPTALDERHGIAWLARPDGIAAVRSRPRGSARELDACARCHSRREQFADTKPGASFTDAYRPALLTTPLYFADGQIRDEVYEYGSFLQSRMNAQGVTCSDCHEPHSQQLRAPGNALCAQCHAPRRFDTPAHHHHSSGSAGTQCIACHMPSRTYMRIDARHDHSLRIPRPDLSATLGVPNACTACHRDPPAAWAARQIRNWYPKPKPGFQDFAAAFTAADRHDPSARVSLIRIARDADEPALVRASALHRLAGLADTAGIADASGAADVAAFESALSDREPVVRAAAVAALAGAAPSVRTQILGSRLDDPSPLVRIELARTLAGTSADGPRLAPLMAEAIAEQQLNADRPEARVEAGNLAAARGQLDRAEENYRAALRLDSRMSGAAINLADLLRTRGEEARAEQVLREALRPEAQRRSQAAAQAALHHALGLSLVRQGRIDEALIELAHATQLQPEEAHWAYVQVIALADTGRREQARRVLAAALALHPQDRELRKARAALGAAKDGGLR